MTYMYSRVSAGPAEKCWRVPAVPGVVMFNGHHNHDFMPHYHDVATVVLVTKGAYRLEIEDKSHIVSTGDLVLIGANQIHSAQPISAEGWDMRTLHTPPELLPLAKLVEATSGDAINFASPVRRLDPKGAALFMTMHRRCDSEGDADRQHEQLRDFLDWMRIHIDAFEPRLVYKRPEDKRVQRAKELIELAAFDSTWIDAIAEEVGLSPFALTRRFKKSFGISPHAWRMQLRAGEAARMLRGGADLADVAMSCGFSDQPHMTRIFRKVYGVTPGQYKIIH